MCWIRHEGCFRVSVCGVSGGGRITGGKTHRCCVQSSRAPPAGGEERAADDLPRGNRSAPANSSALRLAQPPLRIDLQPRRNAHPKMHSPPPPTESSRVQPAHQTIQRNHALTATMTTARDSTTTTRRWRNKSSRMTIFQRQQQRHNWSLMLHPHPQHASGRNRGGRSAGAMRRRRRTTRLRGRVQLLLP